MSLSSFEAGDVKSKEWPTRDERAGRKCAEPSASQSGTSGPGQDRSLMPGPTERRAVSVFRRPFSWFSDLTSFVFMMFTTMRNLVGPRTLCIVERGCGNICLLIGYNNPTASLLRLWPQGLIPDEDEVLPLIPRVSHAGMMLQVALRPEHPTTAQLKAEAARVLLIPEPRGFLKCLTTQIDQLTMFPPSPGTAVQSSGLIIGRALELSRGSPGRIMALTASYGPSSTPSFIGRQIIQNDVIIDPCDVSKNVEYRLVDVVTDDEGEDVTLERLEEEDGVSLLNYNRFWRGYALNGAYVTKAFICFRKMFNIIQETKLAGIVPRYRLVSFMHDMNMQLQ